MGSEKALDKQNNSEKSAEPSRKSGISLPIRKISNTLRLSVLAVVLGASVSAMAGDDPDKAQKSAPVSVEPVKLRNDIYKQHERPEMVRDLKNLIIALGSVLFLIWLVRRLFVRHRINEMEALLNTLENKLKDLTSENENFKQRIMDLEKRGAELDAELFLKDKSLDQTKGELTTKQQELEQALERFKMIEGFKNSDAVISAVEMANDFSQRLQKFQQEIKHFLENQEKDNQFSLFITINPELEGLIKEMKIQLSILTSCWLDENLPEVNLESNKRTILPLLMQFEQIEGLMNKGLYKSCYEEILKLTGKIDLLEAMNGEMEENDIGKQWSDYLQTNTIPNDWVDDQNGLINFFEIFEIEEIETWSLEFQDKVRKDFRRIAVKLHPDHNNGESGQFIKAKLAQDIFVSEELFGKYTDALKTYRMIYSNLN